MSADTFLRICAVWFAVQAAMSVILMVGGSDKSPGMRAARVVMLLAEVGMAATAWSLLP